ncbi:MAG: hypothetical protein R3C05_24135 [Pirellulaceae bacterium]
MHQITAAAHITGQAAGIVADSLCVAKSIAVDDLTKTAILNCPKSPPFATRCRSDKESRKSQDSIIHHDSDPAVSKHLAPISHRSRTTSASRSITDSKLLPKMNTHVSIIDPVRASGNH